MNRNGKIPEFTPIGYVKEKRASGAVDLRSPIANHQPGFSEEYEKENQERISSRKALKRNSNDTVNSRRLFSDSDDSVNEEDDAAVSFDRADNSISELNYELPLRPSNNVTFQNTRKNLLPSLEERSNITHPIKEQQIRLSNLEKEVQNLRLQCLLYRQSLLGSRGPEQQKHMTKLIEKASTGEQINLELSEENKTLKQKISDLSNQLTAKELNHVDNEQTTPIESELAKFKNEWQLLKEDHESLKKFHEDFKTETETLKTSWNEEKRELEDQIRTLESKIEIFVSQNRNLNLQTKELQELLESLKGENEKILSEHKALRSSKEKLEDSLQANEKILLRYKDEIVGLKNGMQVSTSTSSNEISTLKDLLTEKDKELAKLISNRKSMETELGEIKAHLDASEQKRHELESQLRRAVSNTASMGDSNRHMLDEKESELRDMINQKNIAEAKNKELRSENSQLREDLEILKTSNSDQCETIELLRAELRKVEGQIKDSVGHQQLLEEKLNEKEKHIQQYKAKIESRENELGTRASNLLKDVETKDSLIEELRKKVENLRRQVAQSAMRSSNEVNDQLRKKKELIETQQAEINRYKTELESRMYAEKDTIALYEEKLDHMKIDLEDTKRELENKVHELETLKQSTVNDKVLEELKLQSSKAQKFFDDVLAERNGQIEKLRSQIIQLETNDSNVANVIDELSRLKEAYAQKYEANQTLKLANRDLEQKFNRLQDDYKHLQAKHRASETRNYMELNKLQDDNIKLLRQLDETSIVGGSQESRYQVLEDMMNLYRLKYHREVERNNDMYVALDYLNRVLRNATSISKNDIMKVESELDRIANHHIAGSADEMYIGSAPNSRSSNLYDYPTLRSPYMRPQNYAAQARQRFRVYALFVMAACRMRSIAIKRRIEDNRMRILQRDIDRNRISW